jgi:membrane protease YdiL (CAAX protease family)
MLREQSNLGQPAPWKIWHIVCVIVISNLFSLVLYALARLFIIENQVRQTLALYLSNTSSIVISIIWVRVIHRAAIGSLGLTRGRWSSFHLISGGILAGIGCYIVTALILGHRSRIDLYLRESLQSIVLLKFTLSGLAHFILVPIAEELLTRGYVYGYLKSRLGVLPGLLVQSAIFALFHTDQVLSGSILVLSQKVIIGLVFGALYEMSGSLYPAMISHATLNLLAFFPSVTSHVNPT